MGQHRHRIFLATKTGERSGAAARAELERSLARLQVDSVDLLQLHCPPPDVYDMPEVFGILDDLVAAGKLRSYGVSVERVEEALKAMEYPGVQSVQIVFNLLSNAVKFTDEGGQVELQVRPEGAGVLHMQVRDTGIGIRPEDFNRLFVEFQQIDSGADRRYQGTGLGLALTRKLVEFQHGEISVQSAPGQGSTFTVVLPLHEMQEAPAST